MPRRIHLGIKRNPRNKHNRVRSRDLWQYSHKRWLSWLLAFLFVMVFTVSWGSAQETQPQAPKDWQMKGIVAALYDRDPLVWVEAVNKLSSYKLDDPKSPVEIPQLDIRKLLLRS